MKYSEMTPDKAQKRKAYLRARYLKNRVLKKDGTFRSKYRFKNDGNGSGITTHKIIAEKILGKPLPKGACVHHVDGNGLNNEHENLVICPSHAYHALLHRRQKALDACGNPNWLPCALCREHDDPKRMKHYIPKDQTSPRAVHPRCQSEYDKQRRTRKGDS